MSHLIRTFIRTPLNRSIMLTGQRMQHQQQTQCCKRSKLPPKLQRLQKLFQEKNDLPVFLKGGAKDKMLYYSTLGLAGMGLLYNVVFLAGYIID
ncbi:cytochrome c oxidase subunit 7A1, mitochondrial-like [Lucilia sericata]|uniref:cytochrome c oxidase subunit 7A1, mitochondrial-like n=1 Tax=Lucilia sericata TaxID=13632 RepID=UPI0018A85A39|nr:cytochrome c oxidase subunit 7A1, mitochondrial-like [Lucilia sericata]